MEETWQLTDEYSTIRSLDLQVLSAQLGGLRGRVTKAVQTTQRDRSDAETPDAPSRNAHSRFLPVEEAWPLTAEYWTT